MPGGKTVWLVGMMGSGKSSVGPPLAGRLGLPFVDTDAEIENEAGGSVADLFETEGETRFRARERAAIERHAECEAVVALGGGAIAQEGAVERLVGSGVVVYLRASPATLLERLGACEGRPLLRGLGAEARRERLGALLEERRDAYESASVVIDTDDRPVGELVDELAGRLAAALPR